MSPPLSLKDGIEISTVLIRYKRSWRKERSSIILSEGKQLIPDDFVLETKANLKEEERGMGTLNLEEMEAILIRKALVKHHGNISRAAGELGLTRPALYRRMDKYGL